MSEIVYSSQRQNFQKGRIYQNPRFFDGNPTKDATSVIVVGHWPAVVAAYEAANIPVSFAKPGETLPESMPATATTIKPTSNSGKTDDNDPPPALTSSVDIPDDAALKDMGYKELKLLVNQIDEKADIASKRDAIAFLQLHRKPAA